MDENSEKIMQKAKDLAEESNKQQVMIFQTCQALNLCFIMPEFIGSTEQVEAERVLLVSRNKHKLTINYIYYHF